MNSGSVNSILAITLDKQWLKPERPGGRQSCQSSGLDSLRVSWTSVHDSKTNALPLRIMSSNSGSQSRKGEKAKGCFSVLLFLSIKEANPRCPLLTCPSPHGPD